jgi:ascorbate-specific PTS system EIIC-type component UlaA
MSENGNNSQNQLEKIDNTSMRILATGVTLGITLSVLLFGLRAVVSSLSDLNLTLELKKE